MTATERALTEQYLVKIHEFAENIGAKFLVVILPQESQLGRNYSVGGRMQDVLIEQLDRHQIPFIDLFPVMQEAYLAQPNIDWYYDDAHPYKPGHRLIGEYLAKEIPRRFPGVFVTPVVAEAKGD